VKTEVLNFGRTHGESPIRMMQFNGLPECEKQIAVSPNGQLALIQGKTCRLYDIESGELLTEVSPRFSSNRRAWFSPCGRLFGTGGAESLFNIWSVESHRDIAKICMDDEQLTRVVTSPHSSFVGMVSVDRYVAFYCHIRKEQLGFPEHVSRRLSIEGDAAFDDDGQLVVAERELTVVDGAMQVSFRLFRMPNGEPYGIANIPMSESVSAFRLSTDARILLTWDYGQSMQGFDTTTGERLWSTASTSESFRKVTFSGCGKRCLIWSKGTIDDYRDCQSGKPLKFDDIFAPNELLDDLQNKPDKFKRDLPFVTDAHMGRRQYVGLQRMPVAVSSSGRTIVVSEESMVTVFDYETPMLRELASPIRYIDSVSCSDDGAVVAACGTESSAVLWKLGKSATEGPDAQIASGIRQCFTAAPFGLAAFQIGDQLSLFDLSTRKLTPVGGRSFRDEIVGCWRTTAPQLLVASDCRLEIYDTESGQWDELSALSGDDVVAVSCSSDDQLLALGFQDKCIEVFATWQSSTPRNVARLSGIVATQVSFSTIADQLYISDSGGTLWQWNFSAESVPAIIFESSESRRITSFSLREDARLAVVSLATPEALFVDLTTGSALRALPGAHCPTALAAGLRYTIRSSDQVEVVDQQTGEVIEPIDHALDSPVWLGHDGYWAGVGGTASPLVLQLPEDYRTSILPEIASPWAAPSEQTDFVSPHLVITQLRVRLRRWVEVSSYNSDHDSLKSILHDALDLIQSVIGQHETAEQSLQIREPLGILLSELTAAVVIMTAEADEDHQSDAFSPIRIRLLEIDEEKCECVRDFVRICSLLSNWMLRGAQSHTIALNDETTAALRQRCDRIAKLLSKHGHEGMFPVHVSRGEHPELDRDLTAIEYALLHAQDRGDGTPESSDVAPPTTIGLVPVSGIDSSSGHVCFLSTSDHFLIASESSDQHRLLSLFREESEIDSVQWVDLSGKNTSFHACVDPRCAITFQSAGCGSSCLADGTPSIAFWGGYDFDGVPLQVEDRQRRISDSETGVEFQFPHLDALATSDRDFGPLPLAHYERWSLQDLASSRHCKLREFGPRTGTRERFLQQDWRSVSILHLSTHGKVHVADRMLADFVVHNDERITYFDILLQDWSSFDLVFLNCCLSAEGGATTGDETLSIASAFLRGGAGTVIAHRHKIKDAAAALFARAFYTNLLEESADRSIARAFRAGVQTVKAFPGFDDPQIWGSFMKYDNPFRRQEG